MGRNGEISFPVRALQVVCMGLTIIGIISDVRIKEKDISPLPKKIKEEWHCSCSGLFRIVKISNQPDKSASQSSIVVFSIEKHSSIIFDPT